MNKKSRGDIYSDKDEKIWRKVRRKYDQKLAENAIFRQKKFQKLDKNMVKFRIKKAEIRGGNGIFLTGRRRKEKRNVWKYGLKTRFWRGISGWKWRFSARKGDFIGQKWYFQLNYWFFSLKTAGKWNFKLEKPQKMSKFLKKLGEKSIEKWRKNPDFVDQKILIF